MASLRDIRKRIRSVKNTQQITKAMKMVAAAKLRKAQDAIIAARPYAQAVEILKDYPGLFAHVSFATASDVAEEATHRFLREESDAVFVVYNEFVSAISQRVVLTQVLPLQSIVPASSREGEGAAPRGIDFLYEPSREAVFDRLVAPANANQNYPPPLGSPAS